MEIIIALICISLVIAVIFLASFILSLKDGQYEDMETPSIRILFDNKLKTEQDNGTRVEHKNDRG
jgi:cbb3-type cytochrome oxidase maturation protein